MNFKDMLEKMSQLSEATEKTKTGVKHTADAGGYGRKVDASDDDDNEPKKKRGGQEKDSGPKFDTPKGDIFGRTSGKAPAGKKGTQITPMKDADKAEKKKEKEEKKKGLKEWMQQVSSAMNEAEQISIQPAQQNTQVIKQGTKTLGTVTNPQLAAQIKQSIGKGEMTLNPHEQEMAEADYSAKSARAGKDIGKPGKAFAQIAKSAGERYGSKERGEKVAGAVLAKLRGKHESVEEDSEKWIQGAIKHPGALTKKAKAAGMSVSAFAKKHAHDSGTTGKQARLAQTLGKMHHEDMTEADLPSHDADLGAGLGAGRSQWFEGRTRADNKAEKAGKKVTKDLEYDMGHKGKDDKKAERAGKKVTKDIEYDEKKKIKEGAKPDFLDMDKDGNKKESMKKAVADKKKTKVKESMESRLKAAHHAGKSHALGKQNYNCHYDDMEEARMYHEGYKQGLDECYGQMPIQGYVGEESSSDIVDNMASYGAYDELDEVSRGDYLKQQAAKPGDTFKAFGQTFHDKDVLENTLAFESWDNQLNSLLTEYQGIQEGMTVSISKGQQGTPDSVSVTAQDSEADQLLSIIKQAGLGLFGGDDAGQHTGPMTVDAGDAEPVSAEIDVVDDHDGMMNLIKKITGGSVGPQGGEIAKSDDDSEDYEEEDQDESTCNECGMYESDCGCDHEHHGDTGSKEQVEEVESEDQMTYQVAEDNPPDSGAAEVDAEDASVAAQNAGASSHGGAMNSNLEEDEEVCSHCHKSPCECEDLEESYANSADDTFETDADFMMNDITSGLNKRKVTGQTTIPVIAGQNARMHSHNTSDVNESINDWKALAGIK